MASQSAAEPEDQAFWPELDETPKTGRYSVFSPSLLLWILSGLIPLFIFVIALIFIFTQQQDSAVRLMLEQSAKTFAITVERGIGEQFGILNGLSVSTCIDKGDFSNFRKAAHRLWDIHPEWRTLILTDWEKPIFNLYFPLGDPIPPIRDPKSLMEVWNTQQTSLGNLAHGYMSVRVPVIRGNRVRHTIVAPLSPDYFKKILTSASEKNRWHFILTGDDRVVITASDEAQLKTGDILDPVFFKDTGKPLSTSGMIYSEAAVIQPGNWQVFAFTRTDQARAPFLKKRLAVYAGAGLSLVLAVTLILLSTVAYAARQNADHLREQISQQNASLLRQKQAVTAANVGLWEWDILSSRIIFSPEWKHQIGFKNHEIKNKYDEWESRVHPEDIDAAKKNIRHMISGHLPECRMEFRLRHKDGSYRWILSQISLVTGNDGHPVKLMGAHIDITENKLTEKRLKDSEARFRVIFEQAGVGVALVDGISGRFLRINQRYSQMLGYSIREMLELRLTYQDITHPDDLARDTMKFKKMQSDKTHEYACEKRYCRKDGSIIWVSLTVSVVTGDEQSPRLHIAVVEDITRRKQAEAERKRLAEQLSQAQKMESIGTLAGGVAHDFNNFLSMILGNAELALQDTSGHENLYEYLTEIRDAGQKAAGIVRQLLNFSRKNHQEQLKPINAPHVLSDAAKFVRSVLPATIDINTRIPQEAITILGNPVQLNQILINLCTNASQAMEKTGGTLDIEVLKTSTCEFTAEPGQAYLKITVKDNGPGIDKKNLNKIFEPYFTTKDVGKGTGLGLAVVHGIVKAHNGRIFAHSSPGRGTCFTLYFPTVTLSADPGTDKHRSTVLKGRESILFVDDETAIVRFSEKALTKLGYRVTTAATPVEAMEIVRQQKQSFDLIVTDMTMPQMTGLQMARKLKPIIPQVPIIICTGYSNRIDLETISRDGIERILTKPVSVSELAQCIREVLDRVSGA